MQKFTRFYGKVAYLGMISDFSTSLRFLFYELISGFQILISVISPRAYEISPSVGPLGFLRSRDLILNPAARLNQWNEIYCVYVKFSCVQNFALF